MRLNPGQQCVDHNQAGEARDQQAHNAKKGHHRHRHAVALRALQQPQHAKLRQLQHKGGQHAGQIDCRGARQHTAQGQHDPIAQRKNKRPRWVAGPHRQGYALELHIGAQQTHSGYQTNRDIEQQINNLVNHVGGFVPPFTVRGCQRIIAAPSPLLKCRFARLYPALSGAPNPIPLPRPPHV